MNSAYMAMAALADKARAASPTTKTMDRRRPSSDHNHPRHYCMCPSCGGLKHRLEATCFHCQLIK